MTNNDFELLQDYAQKDSEDSFTEVVRRHLNLVYSAALRQVRSEPLAEEVAQSVFTDLARNANRLAPGTVITAWLYQVTRRTAVDVIRRESRRQLREQTAAEMNALQNADAEWPQVGPLLDEAMQSLDETDRAAILLRYFENKPLREVGVALGISDDAAQKRVSRAVERLHDFLKQRGVGIGAAGLIALISVNAAQAAPVGLAISISAAALAGSAGLAATATTATTAKTIIAMTATQKTIVFASLILAAGMGIYTTAKTTRIKSEAKDLSDQQSSLSAQLSDAQKERDAATNRIAALTRQIAELESNQNSTELLKLRSEVAMLRKEHQEQPHKTVTLSADDPSTQAFLAARAIAQKITEAIQRMPDKAIPELKLMTDVDWLSATNQANFDTDADVRKTMRNVRNLAKKRLPLGGALYGYTQANNGQLPANLSDLKPFFLSQLNYSSRGTAQLDDATLDAIFSRYELLHGGNISDYPPGTWFIGEKAPVDKDYDSRVKFGAGTDMVINTGLNETGDPDDPSY